MPELPEVETIVRDLKRELKNKKITAVLALDRKVFRLSKEEKKKVAGKKISNIRRRAKIIIFDLGQAALLFHLKLTGQLVLKTKKQTLAGGHPITGQGQKLPNKFSRVIFKFNDHSRLFFNDVRRFGWVKLATSQGLAELDRELGVEPLSPAFTLSYFKQALSAKGKTTIKQALMEQKLFAGLGNIYADESLFAARIKPFRRVGTLKPKEIGKLWRVIPKVLNQAIKHRGTSFNDYVDARGRVGNFLKYLKVYGRAGEKCKNCGGLIKKIKLGGRGTHWCDYCQK